MRGLLRPLRRLAGIRRPQSVRVRITLVAALVTTVAVSAGGWLLIRSVEGGERSEIRQDNEDLIARLANELRAGTDPACLAFGVDPEEVGTAQVSVVDPTGTSYTFATNYVNGHWGMVQQGGETRVAVAEDNPEPADCCQEDPHAPLCPVGGAQPDPLPEDCLDAVPRTTTERDAQPDEELICQDVVEGQTGAAAGGGQATTDEPRADADAGAGGGGRAPDDEGSGAAEAVPPDLSWPSQVANAEIESISQMVSTPDGEMALNVVTPIDQVTEAVNAVRGALLIGLPLGVALVALASWLLVGRALRPVEAIRSEAEVIGGRTLDRRLPEPDSADEIGRLAQTMNAMLERLDTSARRQRQFVADASHELRSPLSAIHTDLEVALLEGDDGDWREAVRASLREEARLEALIADLLVLAAEDEMAKAPPTIPVDLAALADEEATRPRRITPAVLFAGSHAPTSDPANGTEACVIPGSGRQLRQVVGNLMDNAVRHASSEVRVEVTPNGRNVTVTVDDDGPGIPAADRERVFERFTRLDDGRARDQGGAGLGLAVVRSIVTRHGGTVHATTSPLGGARLVVTLPSA